ncbi:hypothetical protein PF011_g14799 [Phytophthora fragariae]|uniref:Uncharacterized protein n=1 Tax=Phytophthora fragariae TaxID=53985 RepID=A0A6A3K3Z7_9STRA|nr:hypothetical protein PF011_g14799 [Phytophthora fragariae]
MGTTASSKLGPAEGAAVSGSVAEADGGVSTMDAKLRLPGSRCRRGGGVQAADAKPQIYGSRGGEAGGDGQAKEAKLALLRRKIVACTAGGEAGGDGQAKEAKLRC